MLFPIPVFQKIADVLGRTRTRGQRLGFLKSSCYSYTHILEGTPRPQEEFVLLELYGKPEWNFGYQGREKSLPGEEVALPRI